MPWIWFDTIDEGCQRKIEMIFRSQIIGVRVLPWDGNFTLAQWVDKHTATHCKIHHHPYYFCEIFMPPSLSPKRQDTHPSWLLNVEWHGNNWVWGQNATHIHVFPKHWLKFFYLQLLTYGRRIPLAELFARIDAVDANTVKRVANRFIFDRVRTKISLNSLNARRLIYSLIWCVRNAFEDKNGY